MLLAVENVLRRHEKVRVYYETAADFSGFEAGAVWDDAKVGIGHFSRWQRLAIVSDVEWIRRGLNFFSFLMPGEMRGFPASETAQACAWIADDLSSQGG